MPAPLQVAPYIDEVRDEGVDPRDAEWQCPDPVYRVHFWHRPAPPPGIESDAMGWWCDEHRLTGAADVHEVIAWANNRVPAGDRYVLYVERTENGETGLIRLAGTDPTES